MAEPTFLVVPSVGRATDAAHMAARDICEVASEIGIEFRLVGGNAVTLLTWAHGVADLVPGRETADADMGADGSYLAAPELLPALEALGYEREDGSRLVRALEDEHGQLDLVVDVLAPSRTGKFETNQTHGDFVVDEVPGLAWALVRDPIHVVVEARLSTGETITYRVPLPDVIAMLCMKAHSYRGRLASRDALDVWRLLECGYAIGVRCDTWPTSATGRDAAWLLHEYFGAVGSIGPRDATLDPARQSRVRALVLEVVVQPGG